jgi:uncharacterized LabA/DUF88 family protein
VGFFLYKIDGFPIPAIVTHRSKSTPMNRTIFLVDGFNLYFSLRQAEKDFNKPTRWLDLKSLCVSTLSSVGNKAQCQDVYYFSALAHHLSARDKYMVKRHQDYIQCLIDTGVKIELGRFKKKMVMCSVCGKPTQHYEEKETDVALALKMMELFTTSACDTVVFVTGDTDLSPALKYAQNVFPAKKVVFAFPHKRRNFELEKLTQCFEISGKRYNQHQFADPYILKSGRAISKPAKW